MKFRRFFATSVLAMGIGMSLGAMSASAAPSSDTFASAGAIAITGSRGNASSDLISGTREASEPLVPGSNTAHTKWWRYIPAANGFARFSTCAPTGANPVPGMSLGLYTGSQVNLLTTVSQATNNCPAGYENAVLGPVAVTAGTQYYLQMGGANTIPDGEENFDLTLDFNTAVPANDNWASAAVISGALPQSFAANNGLTTVEVDEPRSDQNNERQTLWYRWTATATGAISVNTCSSTPEFNMDSRIAVFEGTTPAVASDMSFVDDNDNGCPGAASSMSRVFVPVTNGTKYWIKLSNNAYINYGYPYALQIKWVTTPENSVLPSIFPYPRFKVGTAVSLDSEGTWGGYPSPTFTRQWRLCNAAGASCTNISGATGMSYTPVVGDIGKSLVLQVTATNSNGPVSASSLPSELIDDTPVNDLWANRTLLSGSTVSYPDDNNWATHSESGEPVLGGNAARNSVWYRWTPATSGNYVINNCLGGAPGLDFLDLMIGIRTGTTSLASTTAFDSGDDGCGPSHPYRTSMLFTATAGTNYSIEVASKYAGATGAYTLSIAPVGDPVVTVQPSITGTAAPGGTLNLDVGDWISPTNIVPQIHWLECDSGGSNCVDTGSIGSSFAVLGSHSGSRIRATVTLTNPYGSVMPFATSDVIAQDTDSDGVLDGSDTCPIEFGYRTNGCPPSVVVPGAVPVVSGFTETGQTLTTTNGSWTTTGDPLPLTYTRQWQRCNDSTPASCSNIGGATNLTYVLVADDVGKQIRSVVIAANTDDSALEASSHSAVVTAPPPPPSNSVLPAVSGSTVVGQTLSTSNGTWTPAGVTYAYSWLRCDDTTIGSCSPIGGQTASTYALTATDAGKYIRSSVAATNSASTAIATSNASSIVLGDSDGDGVPNGSDACPAEAGTKPNGCLPSDIVGNGIPTLSGTFNVGQTITSTQGSWTVLHDQLAINVVFQWQRCEDATPASCANVGSATASNTYLLTATDYAKRIRVVATASNTDDPGTSQTSTIYGPASQVPVNTALPLISGNKWVGQTLSTSNGTWTPGDTGSFTYSWHRCNDGASFATCTAIGGQTASSYTLVAADNGKYIRSGVTGSAGPNSTFANSAATVLIVTDSDGDGVVDASDACPAEAGTKPNGCLPSDLVPATAPTIVETPNVGVTLTSTAGTWTILHDQLTPTVAYQWERCNDATAGSCSNIAAATASTYTVVTADYGKRIRLTTTATNADDQSSQSSLFSAVVSQVPINNTLPSIGGLPRQGVTVTGNRGSWTPADATFSNVWLRCTDSTVGSCSNIAGQIGPTYTIGAADANLYIRVRFTASTSAGPTTATSAAIGPVSTDSDGDGVPNASDACPAEAGTKPNGCLPSDIVANGIPAIGTVFNVGQTITSSQGSWTELHDQLGINVIFQWQRCNDATAASCSSVGAATTTNTYLLTAADYGKRIRVIATASNADDAGTSQTSGISAAVSQVPVNSTLPSVAGNVRVGQALTGSNGSWTPADASFTRAWLRCTGPTIGTCTPIASQTGTTYTLVAGDNASYIRFQVTATAGANTAVATSAATVQVITDTDNDGVVDASDACPAESGTKPNGCLPSDIVGGSVPTIGTNFTVGQTITSTQGSWTVLHDQLPINVVFQWQRCDDATAASCSNVGAASNTYLLTAADYGKRIRVIATASNADDPGTAQASTISAIVSQVPVNSLLPSITGTLRVGSVLSGATGTWTPADASFARQWMRCTTTSIGSCTPIGSATGASYTLVAADSANYIRFQVTATSGANSIVAISAASVQVITDTDNDGVTDASDACPAEAGTKPNGCLPSQILGTSIPTVSGSLVVGQTVGATDGTWNVLHDQLSYTLSRQWQRCDDATTASCSDIGGASSSTYALTASDLGKRVRMAVTALNADDSEVQHSAISTAVISADSPPVNNVAPTVTGTTEVGKTLTANGASSDWTPSNATLAYAWLRCTDDASEASCSVIGSAASPNYVLVAADSGSYIRARVTATANALSSEIVSAAGAKVTTPPVVTPPPPTLPNPATITGPANLKTLKASKTGAVTFSRVSIYCGSKSSGNCTGSAVLTGKIGAKTKKLGTLKLSNLKGGGRIIAMKLSRSALKALNKKSIKAQLAITYTSPGFETLTYLGKVTLQKLKK